MHEQMEENRGKILHIIVCVNERERERALAVRLEHQFQYTTLG